LGELFDGLLIESPETFDLVSEFHVDGAIDGLGLFTGLDVQQVLDVSEVLVTLLTLLLRLLSINGTNEGRSQLLDCVSSDGDLNGMNSSSAISELEEVSVVDLGGNDGILRLSPGKFLGESRVQFLDELGGEKIVRAGDGGIDGLGQGKDGTSLALHHDAGHLEWTVNIGKTLEGRVDEGTDIAGRFEPGGEGNLLPDGDISVSAVEKKGEGGISDLRMFTLVEGGRDEDGQNLLLNDLVGEDVTGLTINWGLTLTLTSEVGLLTGADQVLEGEDGFGLDE